MTQRGTTSHYTTLSDTSSSSDTRRHGQIRSVPAKSLDMSLDMFGNRLGQNLSGQ